MLTKIYGVHFLSCDKCGEDASKTFEDIFEAAEWQKENGWESKGVFSGREDTCLKCLQTKR